MSSRFAMSASMTVGILAVVGLGALVYYEPPTSLFTALALFLVLVAVSGVTSPFWRLLLRKVFSRRNEQEVTKVSLRFGLWTGVFIASVMLLKVLDFMDRVLILAVLALLIMLEMFFQQNEARKRPSRKTRR